MKKFFTLLVLAACCAAMTWGCSDDKYDDTEIRQEIENLKQEIASMKEQVNSLKTIIDALNENKFITNYTEAADGSCTITFNDGKTITLHNGKDGAAAPAIGIAQFEGIYYWTLGGDDQWLLDDNQNKIPVAGQNGKTPTINKDGYWEIDGETIKGEDGQPIKAVGKDGANGDKGEDGDSFFKSVVQDDENVTFTLTNGDQIVLPKAKEVNFVIERTSLTLKFGASEAYALTAGGWIPTVEMTSAPAGWTADFDIARRSLLIAPPAEYTDGMDLENTVTIQSDDKPILSQEYYVLDFTHPEGTFVLIEGNMTSENGTIVYFDQHMRYHEKVYEEINDNEIGNVLQDMYLANGKIYFITQNGKTSSMGTTFNGDGRFVVCDAHTMKRLVARDMPFYANIDTSTGATQSSKSTLCWPQHIVVVSPEKAYIQYSTADNESHSGIRIVDLQTNIIRTSDIPGTFGVFTKTGATKARMIFSRGKVFAGRGNSVIVLDPATDAVIKTVTYENRQVKDLAKGYDGKIYAIFTGEFTGNSGMTGAASFTKPAMIVALDANGEVVSETNLPEQIELRTGTASPTVQMCASFTQPHLYFIGKQDFSAYEAMRYNYETGKVNWDYITADLDADHSGGDIIYGYMGVHPTTEQLWVGKSTYTQSAVHVYDVSRSDALEFSSFYQKKASPAGVDFAYRFSDEWINR